MSGTRFKIVQDSATQDELLQRTVSRVMQDLHPDFEAAGVSAERQRIYREIARRLLQSLAGEMANSDVELDLPDALSDDDITGIVNATVAAIERIYLKLSEIAVDSLKEAVRTACDADPARRLS